MTILVMGANKILEPKDYKVNVLICASSMWCLVVTLSNSLLLLFKFGLLVFFVVSDVEVWPLLMEGYLTKRWEKKY